MKTIHYTLHTQAVKLERGWSQSVCGLLGGVAVGGKGLVYTMDNFDCLDFVQYNCWSSAVCTLTLLLINVGQTSIQKCMHACMHGVKNTETRKL